MELIVNLTQHKATDSQLHAGVQDMDVLMGADAQQQLKNLLTFEGLPTLEAIKTRAACCAGLALDACKGVKGTAVMIGGAPFFMGALESALKKVGLKPTYAFSERHQGGHAVGRQRGQEQCLHPLGLRRSLSGEDECS